MYRSIQKSVCVFLTLFVMGVGGMVYSGRAYAINGYSIQAITNSNRAGAGLAGLSYNSALAYAAQLRAQDMIENDYWSHTSPSGLGMSYFLNTAGYPIYTAGENLSRGYDSDSAVVSAWMASSGHRANIMNANFNEIGVGFASGLLGTEYTTIVVAYYGAQGPIYTPPPAPAPAPEPTPQSTPAPQPVRPAQPASESVVAEAPIEAQPTPVAEPTVPVEVKNVDETKTSEAESTSEASVPEASKPYKHSLFENILYVFHYFQLLYTVKLSSLGLVQVA